MLAELVVNCPAVRTRITLVYELIVLGRRINYEKIDIRAKFQLYEGS